MQCRCVFYKTPANAVICAERVPKDCLHSCVGGETGNIKWGGPAGKNSVDPRSLPSPHWPQVVAPRQPNYPPPAHCMESRSRDERATRVEKRDVAPRETEARDTQRPDVSSAATAAEPDQWSGHKGWNAEDMRRNMGDGREPRYQPPWRTTKPPRHYERTVKAKPTPPHSTHGEEDAPHEDSTKEGGAFSERFEVRYLVGKKKVNHREETDEDRSKRARSHYSRARQLGYLNCQDRFLRDELYWANCDKDGHDVDRLAEFEILGNPDNRDKNHNVPREVRVMREYKRWEERDTIPETEEGPPANAGWEERTVYQAGTWWGDRAFGKSWSWKK